MRIELLPGLTNFIRFPGLKDPTVGLRDAVDADTLDNISNHVWDEYDKRRQAVVAELLNMVLGRA